MNSYQMATVLFTSSQINKTEILNQALWLILSLAFLSGAFASPFPSKENELEKELEVAHFHQSVLEGDKAQLEACVNFLLEKGKEQPHEIGEMLDEMIIGLLRVSSRNARQILVSIKQAFPHIERGEINSRLYAMSKKGVTKFKRVNGEKAPVWSLN